MEWFDGRKKQTWASLLKRPQPAPRPTMCEKEPACSGRVPSFIAGLSRGGPVLSGEGLEGLPAPKTAENLWTMPFYFLDHALLCNGKTLLLDGNALLCTVNGWKMLICRV